MRLVPSPRSRVVLAAVALLLSAAAPAVHAARKDAPVRANPRAYRAVVGAARALARPIQALSPHVEVIGGEHIRGLNGPAVLASSHIANVDPVVLALATRRVIHYMGKIEVFRAPVLGGFARAMGSFPVDRAHPDLPAINRASAQSLTGRDLLGIFPEGTTAALDLPGAAAAQAKLTPASTPQQRRHARASVLFGGTTKPGAAYQAVVNDVPIVPVVILGTRKLESAPKRLIARLRGQRAGEAPPKKLGLKVIYGAPITPSQDARQPQSARVRALQREVEDAQRQLAAPYLRDGQREIW